MADLWEMSSSATGQITEGPTATLTERTIDFVASELAAWRDDPNRVEEQAEERLNAQLCKYLNVAAGDRFPMVLFHHEEKQTGSRRVDFAANPRRGMIVGSLFRSIYDPFVVFEGKRLPAPSKAREREYVTGGLAKSGGIQRFKRGLHGAQQETAVIVAYVQSGAASTWRPLVNSWIVDEVTQASMADETWMLDEQLDSFHEHSGERTARATSKHRRCEAASVWIKLVHLWIEM